MTHALLKARFIVSLSLLVCSFFCGSCKKYLDVKPIKTQVVPDNLRDMQALLDNSAYLNERYPVVLEVISDDYYVLAKDLFAAVVRERDNYLWNANATFNDAYNQTYEIVSVANVVLEELKNERFRGKEDATYNNVKGQALFFRSFAYYYLAQLYCKAFTEESASTDAGIILRQRTDMDELLVRASVRETYERIVSDLREATMLLPESVDLPLRPGKAAAFGALARVSLAKGDYKAAGDAADSCLKRKSDLMDFNELDSTARVPITRFNKEVILHGTMGALRMLASPRGKIDTTLFRSYEASDLRRVIYFVKNADATYSFKGSYDGTTNPGTIFNGLATDEMLLIRAESFARAGNTEAALADLNHLKRFRFKRADYTPFEAAGPEQALSITLSERRKELPFRAHRWTDLRRYNAAGANISLKRIVDGTEYSLPAGDPRWVLLLPAATVNLSGIPQNPR